MTDQKGKLAAALAKAQKAFEPPKKDKSAEVEGTTKSGSKYKYKYHYSDLASLIDAIREPLAANGLAYLQPMAYRDGVLMLRTILAHESGEQIDSEIPIPSYDKPQELGSYLTYARRYSLGALVGLAPEDDDGEAAQKAEPARRPAAPAQKPASNVDAQILALADALSNLAGERAEVLIERASAFYGKGHQNEGDDMSARERWLEAVPFQPKVRSFADPSKQSSEKWKTRTLLNLKERIKVLESEMGSYDPENSEADLFNQPDPD